jgi:DNA-binding IclR family transcriptional regulator
MFMGQEKDIAEGKVQRAVQSVEVGGRILLALANSRTAMNLKDLSAETGMAPSRAHSYLVSFVRLGLIRQDSAGRYDLGPAALHIGLAFLQRLDPYKEAEPVVEELAEITGHTVVIAVWGNFGPTVVKMIEAKGPLHISMRMGSVLSIFDTATGRAFASVLAQSKLSQAVAGPIGELLGKHELKKRWGELEEIQDEMAKHGMSRVVGSPIPGVNALSAPVFDLEGHPIFVVTMTDNQDRLSANWDSASALALKQAIQQITEKIGGVSNPKFKTTGILA